MSDDDNSNIKSHSKRKHRLLVVENSSSDDSVVNPSTQRRRKIYIQESETDETDSDSSCEIRPRKRALRVSSDSSDSANLQIIQRPRTSSRLESSTDSNDGSSSWESADETASTLQPTSKIVKPEDEGTSSDSSDGQAEKCPICLLTFKKQEVGSPEACDHSFCAECIQEWAKSVNTCPVDRKKFGLILVRSSYGGEYLRSVPIQEPSNNLLADAVEAEIDFTCCEVCGLSTNEDRLLLCDGCDLAFHLDCLEPPLTEVPVGEWFCPICSGNSYNRLVDFGYDAIDVEENVFELRYISWRNGVAAWGRTSRLIPRTRQSERIRTRIIHQRENTDNNNAEEAEDPHPAETNQAGPSTSRRPPTSVTRKKKTIKKRKRKCKKSKRKPRYKITYEIDEVTGEKIAIKKKTRKRKYKRKTKKRKARVKRVFVPKSVKNRLARQLGICPPKRAGQSLPDMKVQINPGDIGHRRSQAGIPALHLFGQRDQLDYFSESDSEIEGAGVNIVLSRRPTMSDASLMRRAARNKASAAAIAAPCSSTPAVDVLGSILDTQTKLHSKNSFISIERDGTIKIDVDKKAHTSSRNLWSNNKQINVNSNENSRIRQTPLTPHTTTSDRGNTNNSNSNQYNNRSTNYSNYANSTVPTSTVEYSTTTDMHNRFRGNQEDENPQDYSLNNICSSVYEPDDPKDEKRKSENSSETLDDNGAIGNSDSELDIYSDIESVSTSKMEDQELKYPSPLPCTMTTLNASASTNTPDDDNESDIDLVIDTEKLDAEKYDPAAAFDSDNDDNAKEEPVTSTSESLIETHCSDPVQRPWNSEIQSETVQSSNQSDFQRNLQTEDEDIRRTHRDDESEEDCPNFSIYSTESLNLAKTAELNILMPPNEEIECQDQAPNKNTNREKKPRSGKNKGSMGLYSDSEDETIIKFNTDTPFGIADLRNMTEDISEEERSYTPCLDEKEPLLKEGLDGLDTEMISDDDKNDFEETQELKTVSDTDALEINAKESELDFSRPEDCEEGEIIDRLLKGQEESKDTEDGSLVEKPTDNEIVNNTVIDELNKEPVFKKLSKSNKERNYRDKENREKSKSKERREKTIRGGTKRDKRKEKRREIERYDVRSLVETKPKRDQFGRDPTRRRSHSSSKSVSSRRGRTKNQNKRSRSHSSRSVSPKRFGRDIRNRSPSVSSRSITPQRSLSRGRNSLTPDKTKRARGRSPSRSKSRGRKRTPSRQRKRRRSLSKDRPKPIKKPTKIRSRQKGKSRSRSPRREWDHRRQSRGWSASLSRSQSPEPRHFTPTWTPPRVMSQSVRPQNLTVILPNDSSKKRRDKRKKLDKRGKEISDKQKKRKRTDKSPIPSKEVFASGSNILVSVSFNKDNEVREARLRRKRGSTEELITKRMRKEKEKQNKTKVRRKNRTTTNIKPVAIIDLDKSPFKEITPSPKDIIVLSDSDNADSNDLLGLQNSLRRDTPQQTVSPGTLAANYMNSTGPKTPPEPQVKFTFTSKQQPLRQINNPLHEADDVEDDIDPQEELENRLNEVMHKGPNTPPEPPNSPPSSPDAYDPFDPTKSRTPTPEPKQSNVQSSSITQIIEDTVAEIENRSVVETIESSTTPTTLAAVKSHTPPIPIADVQPADSQSSVRVITPDTNIDSSPERPIGVVINQMVQSQVSVFPVVCKSVAPTATTSLITSTPISSNLSVPRVNVLSSTVITPPIVTSSIPQRIILPSIPKSSPVNKVSPTKTSLKPMPIKPMLSSKISGKQAQVNTKSTTWKNKNRNNENNEANIDFDSPYSPGSSDYEDLFEPPPENQKPSAPKTSQTNKNTKNKSQTAFDVLFGSSPVYTNKNKKKTTKVTAKKIHGKGTKQVGVKLDEDNLKIMDELPNSAVEMQVKDKFLKKLNRQERVVEEVKFVLKPYYNKKRVNKEEYKDILRRAVPKICHNKSGEINPKKIQSLVEAYVKKVKHNKKVTSSSSVNPQKTEVVSNWLSKLS